MYNPLISVCIAVYNRQKFIRAAIESVLNQTYQNFEILIIDVGSTDNSVSIIESIADSRIKLFKNESNKGVVYTRNRYLELASGAYIAILDSDDSWLPEKLEKQLHFFSFHQDYGICGTTARKEYENGKMDIWKYPTTDSEIRARLLWGSAMIHSSLMFRKKIKDEHNFKYDCTIKQAEDYDFIRQFVSVAKAYNIEEVLTRYAVHENQFTSEAKEEQVSESIKVAYRYCEDLGIQMNQEQVDVFQKIYNFKFNLTINELKLLKDLFIQIGSLVNKNDLQMMAFNNSLAKQWYLACYHSSKNGFEVIKLFYSYIKRSESTIPIQKKVKLFLKCFLK